MEILRFSLFSEIHFTSLSSHSQDSCSFDMPCIWSPPQPRRTALYSGAPLTSGRLRPYEIQRKQPDRILQSITDHTHPPSSPDSRSAKHSNTCLTFNTCFKWDGTQRQRNYRIGSKPGSIQPFSSDQHQMLQRKVQKTPQQADVG